MTEPGRRRSSRPAGSEKVWDLAAFLPYRLSVVSNSLSADLARLYADRYGLSVPEWRVVAILGAFGRMTASEVVVRTAMDKVQVSRSVARLKEAGHLERQVDPEDRRRAHLSLTAAGQALYREVVPRAEARFERLLDGVSETDKALIDRAVGILEEVVGSMPAAD